MGSTKVIDWAGNHEQLNPQSDPLPLPSKPQPTLRGSIKLDCSRGERTEIHLQGRHLEAWRIAALTCPSFPELFLIEV